MKIIITENSPETEEYNDSAYSSTFNIFIPEDTTASEAVRGFVRALQIEQYPDSVIVSALWNVALETACDCDVYHVLLDSIDRDLNTDGITLTFDSEKGPERTKNT